MLEMKLPNAKDSLYRRPRDRRNLFGKESEESLIHATVYSSAPYAPSHPHRCGGGGGFLDLGLLDDGPFLRTTASARASEVTSQVSRLESALKNKSLL